MPIKSLHRQRISYPRQSAAPRSLHQIDTLLQIALDLNKLRVWSVWCCADLRPNIFQLLLVPAEYSKIFSRT
jgi:hypothetical protein